MTVTSRKLSRLLPKTLRGIASRLGLERWRAQYAVREAMLGAKLRSGTAVQHIHGPTDVGIADDELVVLCLVRNGGPWLPTYLRYYQRLGAKHIVILDNGSTDDTIKIATSHDHVTVLSTTLSYATYFVVLERWLVKRFGARGWSLVADADELFDYPYSHQLSLRAFLQYLNQRGYSAVNAHNLEMVAAESLASLQGRQEEDLETAYPYCDLSDITKTRNKFWIWMNRTDTEAHYSHSGGPRESIFGWSGSKLTKQPLIRYDAGVNVFPYDNHFVTGASIADVSGVFRHYKFINFFYQQVQEEVRREEHFNKARIFKQYQKVLAENPDLCLKRPTARRYRRAEDLVESGFLIASEAYEDWVRKHGTATADRGVEE